MKKKTSDKAVKTNAKTNKAVTLIKKSNDLIEARYKFDTWETRIFLSLVAQIRREDDEFNVYRIWYRDIAKVFNLHKRSNYDFLRQAVISLMNKKFVVNTVVDGFTRKEVYHIIRKVNYLEEGQDGRKGIENQEYVDVKIEDEMKPFLLRLQKSFTAYNLSNVVNLGVYSVRVYELLKQYETIGHRLLGFEEMKKMFELENEYPEFANFFRRVIEPSLKEINEFTDIYVHNVEKLKEGKKITAMRFHFRKNPNKMAANEDVQPTLVLDPPVEISKEKPKVNKEKTLKNDERFTVFYQKVVENLGVTPSVLMDLLKEYNDEQFEQAIRVTNRAKMDGQIKSNPSGFFVQALKNGYTDQKEERLKKEKKEATAKRTADQIAALEIEKDSKIFDRLKVLTSSNPNLTDDAIEVLKQSPDMQQIIEAEAEQLGRSLEINDYRQHPTLRMGVINTIISHNMEKFADIILEYDTKINELKMSDAF